MSKFQIILTAIFVVFIIIGVVLFATFKSDNSSTSLPSISIWGTFPSNSFRNFLEKFNQTQSIPVNIRYTEIPESSFRQQFIEALASGKGPDAILLPQQDIFGYYDKIIAIPNTIITQRDFQNTYTSQADLYLTPTGVLAIPFIVDPLVMYWNRIMFTNAGIAKYPRYWDEFSDINKKITQKDVNSNIRKSAIAMGEFSNINNAKEILSTLLFQTNNPITFYSNNLLRSALNEGNFNPLQSSNPALSFYTGFADPRNTEYSWNRSLPSSKNSFLSSNLATYFGFASEVFDIKSKNPNLDFDLAAMPQLRKGSLRTTYGNMYGLSIVRSAADQTSTYNILNMITQPSAIAILSNQTYLPSPRRDMIASGSTDPYMAIFLDSALISRGWLDTSPLRSNQIFTDLIESVTSGRSSISDALKQAHDQLNLSLQTQ